MSVVVVAPDSFKGSASAQDAAQAIAEGWREVRPDDELILLPQADGGEGTLAAVRSAHPGAVLHEVQDMTGPDGRPCAASWLEIPSTNGSTRSAIVEMAQVSGITLLQTLDPVGCTSQGLGELLKSVLDAGVTSLYVGVGGSATSDGGAGMLTGLGAHLAYASSSDPAIKHVERLLDLVGIDLANIPKSPGTVTLLVDSMVPLLGPGGAAATYGPQKGASSQQVEVINEALGVFAEVLGGDPSIPGSGAGGGVGFALATVWNASYVSGARFLAKLTGLTDAVRRADIVVTGEGRFDQTSLTGKAVGSLLQEVEGTGCRPAVVAGSIAFDELGDSLPGLWVSDLSEMAGSLTAARENAEHWLRRAGANAAYSLLGAAGTQRGPVARGIKL